jgi:hypothetical protein
MISVEVDDGLTAGELSAVKDLLSQFNATGPDDFGCYVIHTRDGGSAELFAEELTGTDPCEGSIAAVRAITPELLQFLYDLGRVGNMVIIPIMEETVFAVSSEQQRQRVQSRWPEAVVVETPEELGELIKGGFQAWKAYRDQVVRP